MARIPGEHATSPRLSVVGPKNLASLANRFNGFTEVLFVYWKYIAANSTNDP